MCFFPTYHGPFLLSFQRENDTFAKHKGSEIVLNKLVVPPGISMPDCDMKGQRQVLSVQPRSLKLTRQEVAIPTRRVQ